jgi:hypothetical protein
MRLGGGLSWSWRRALRVPKLRTRIMRKTRIPMTRASGERRIGRSILRLFGFR